MNRTRTPVARYRDHAVVGTPAELGNVLTNHIVAGTLVAATAPRLTADGSCRVVLRLRDTTATRPVSAARRNRRTSRTLGLVVSTAGVIAGLVAAAAYLVGQLVEFVTTHAAQIVGVCIAIGVAFAVAAHATGSKGRHCPGC